MAHQSLNSLNTESSQQIVVMRIQRIIEKYSEVWRVLHEPIQNSIDAIQQRDDITEGSVNVEINLGTGKVIVSDNGKGFPENWDLLLPDGTDKTQQSDTMGYQGVGLKSVIYTSDNFRLSANLGNDIFWGTEITNAANYLNSQGIEEAPIKPLTSNRNEQGTTLEIDFDPLLTVKAVEQIIASVISAESNFQWPWTDDFRENNHFLRDANDAETFCYMLEYYLKTHTYVGSVNRLLNCRLKPSEDTYAKKVTVHILIDFSDIDRKLIEDDFLIAVVNALGESQDTSIELTVDNKFIDFQQVVGSIDKRNLRFDEIYSFDIPKAGIYRDPTQPNILIDNIYAKIMTPDYTADEDDFEKRYAQYISLLQSSSDERSQRNTRVFKDLFPRILGIYILIGRMDYFEKYLGNNYGIKLIAANGIPTQHELTARSSNQSFYFNPVSFVLNVDGKLNEGKSHLIDPSLERKCVKFFREAFESTLNRFSKEFVRSNRRSQNSPREPELVDIPKINIPRVDIRRIPNDENTLIALFYQLLQVKQISLPTYALLQNGVYDGRFTYEDQNIRSHNDLQRLEFKVELSKLLDDFDDPNNAKNYGECDLIIVWSENMRNVQQQDWRVVNRDAVDTSDLSNSGTPDWVSTLLRDRARIYRPIVIVQDWVEELDSEFKDLINGST